MQPRRFSLQSPVSHATRKFNVVVAFDDSSASSTSALKTCDYVIAQLGGDVPVHRRVVNLVRTLTPRTRAAAARDAARADMVIVSTRDDSEMPSPMKEWLDEWTPQRSAEEGALVAILNRADTNPRRFGSPVREQLASLAQRLHMDFFSSEVAAAS